MRYVEIRRHTDNDDDTLSDRGVQDAEAIGRDGLHPPYDAFVSTGANRATQMAGILRDAVGQTDVSVTEREDLRSSAEERWRDTAKQAGKGATVEDMRSVDSDFIDQECRELADALRAVVDDLPEGGRALVVGHSPTNEAAVLGLTGEVVGPMGKGEGVLVTEDGGRYDIRPL